MAVLRFGGKRVDRAHAALGHEKGRCRSAACDCRRLICFGLGPTLIALVADRVFCNPKMVGNSIGIICTIAAALAIEVTVVEIRRRSRNGAPSNATHPKREAI
ncbi:Transmembrane protein [Burkholderia sp. IT-111MI5]